MKNLLLRRVLIGVLYAASCCGVLAATGLPGVWLDVPFVKQDKDGCGAASIAMVMQYWQRHQSVQAVNADAQYAHIEKALLFGDEKGIFASDMTDYFLQHGFAAFTFTGDLSLLQHHLHEGRPLIVALRPGSHVPLHYVVVAGVNEGEHTVLLNDPAQRKLLKQDESAFEREWKATGNWTLLAVPEGNPH
ncbi:MAG TPA: C39 family peptidase [Terracidiphilus sp.]|nr:C39 family peptidase [Terracidiphilus sp.]